MSNIANLWLALAQVQQEMSNAIKAGWEFPEHGISSYERDIIELEHQIEVASYPPIQHTMLDLVEEVQATVQHFHYVANDTATWLEYKAHCEQAVEAMEYAEYDDLPF